MNKHVITTHILDTAKGQPVCNLPVELFKLIDQQWVLIAQAQSDQDGRVSIWQDLTTCLDFSTYRLRFHLDDYFTEQAELSFYPLAEICFRLQDSRHHHIPLLVSPFGYSTYRGS